MKFPFVHLFEGATKEEAQAKAEGWSLAHLRLHQGESVLMLIAFALVLGLVIRLWAIENRVKRLEEGVAVVASGARGK